MWIIRKLNEIQDNKETQHKERTKTMQKMNKKNTKETEILKKKIKHNFWK